MFSQIAQISAHNFQPDSQGIFASIICPVVWRITENLPVGSSHYSVKYRESCSPHLTNQNSAIDCDNITSNLYNLAPVPFFMVTQIPCVKNTSRAYFHRIRHLSENSESTRYLPHRSCRLLSVITTRYFRKVTFLIFVHTISSGLYGRFIYDRAKFTDSGEFAICERRRPGAHCNKPCNVPRAAYQVS